MEHGEHDILAVPHPQNLSTRSGRRHRHRQNHPASRPPAAATFRTGISGVSSCLRLSRSWGRPSTVALGL